MTVLATQSWEQTTSFGHGSLCHHYSAPLAGIDTSTVQDEWDGMILYSK